MAASFDRLELNEILIKYFPEENEQFKNINELLDGDLDLKLVLAMVPDHVAIVLHKKGVVVTKAGMEAMEKITKMNEQELMKAYANHGFFHDGGDDFDYGWGFVWVLYDILKKALEVYKINL
jgi:hypothetical protein